MHKRTCICVEAKAASGKECIWSNSTSLRVSLLAWGGRCPVESWMVAYREAVTNPTLPAHLARWIDLLTDGEVAHITNLQPATWYDIRLQARSVAGDTAAIYRAATRNLYGERIGEPTELPNEIQNGDVGTGVALGTAGWRAVAGGSGALLLAALAAVTLVVCYHRRRNRARRCRTAAFLPPLTHTNGKTLKPLQSDVHEISPYATFSMSSAGASGGGTGCVAPGDARSCALHLRSFVSEHAELAAPPRPHLLAHPNDYGSARDTDSESSGSPCAACQAELYRLPAAHLSDTLPAGTTTAAESSTEDGSYGSRRGRDVGGRARERRPHARGPNHRF
ncbi:cell adhesion molecule Dscam2-like isoform X2 [Leptidea sinapis]|uniref:cell adhesion molecule Dscam2-like isoform X2 n=1 Tax=Leptidea sinapis TaxID=189913 RepID=UPI0021C4B958|nr:cell adhesion molecule Dscam2-like isoform X2 [Leptidea sinapis]